MRVNVDGKMLADPRFKKLGHHLRLSHFEVFGRCLPVWSMAYQNRSAVMAADDVDALAEIAGFADAMLAADLATLQADGRLRLRGVEERIQWLIEQDRKRELANEARRRAKSSKRSPSQGSSSPEYSPGASRGKSPESVPRDFPDQEQDQEQDHDQDPDPERQAPASAPRYPVTQVHNPRTKLNHDTWQYAALEHARLTGEGLAGSMPWPAMPAGAPMNDLVARVREVVDQQGGDVSKAAAILRRRVDVAVAESKREGHLRWFTPSQLWDDRRFYRAIENDPAEAAKPRQPPRGAPQPDQPIRRVKTFS